MATKKMNLSNLKQLNSKLFTQKKIIVGDYEVLIDEVFKETKIRGILKETFEKRLYVNENKLTINWSEYAILLILKYFTDIQFGDKLEEQLQIYEIIDNAGYLNTILNSFDENEMNKLKDKIEQYGINLKKAVEEFDKDNEEIEISVDKIENN
jgi:hypothetical protein